MQIEVRPEAAEPVRFAAEELSRYLTRATGTEAEVTEGDGQFLVAAVDDGEVPAAVAERLSGHGDEGRRISLVFLPTYSPWLNRIEDTWRIVKAHAGTNAWRDNLAQLTAHYQATLTAMNAHILSPTPCFLLE